MRIPVSAPQNIWFDSEDVDDSNLTLEQDFNNQIQTGIINNHFGSGVLPDALNKNVIYDSSTASGLLDGKAINAQSQPTDNNLGNQLAVTLSGSAAAGTRAVKVLIIGLDFQQNLQYDTFTFSVNETQITSQHYTAVLTILFNDLVGPVNQSFNLGGRVVIAEADSLVMSRDCIMTSQDVQPNLFFRDFFVTSGSTLGNVLTQALPSYNINTLNISTGYLQLASIVENDVSSQIGQKFLATCNNIQKVTLLLAVGASQSTPNNFNWTGDILVSIYPLQSVVACQTDITPQLAIEFDPSNVPLAQLSFNYSSLLSNGILLSTVPQPVDFVFSNTPIANGTAIVPGNYYAVTVKRTGSTDNCQIQLAVGANSSTVMWETVFNGSVWTDIPSQSLWFQVWTDAAKVVDGQGYDDGHGIVVPKTFINQMTGVTQNYVLNQLPFVRNDLFYALMQAVTQDSGSVQNERTGNNVFSEQQFVPSVSLLNIAGLNNIQNVSSPFIIGTITDQNIKTFVAANSTLGVATTSASLSSSNLKLTSYGMVNNELVLKVITDQTDGYRYNQNIIELVAEIVEGKVNFGQFNVDTSSYRIAKVEIFTMLYGDVDGDGVVTVDDLMLAQELGATTASFQPNLNVMPTHQQYITNTTFFITDHTGVISWQVVNTNTNTIVGSGSDGLLTANPNNTVDGYNQADFNSPSANFGNLVTNLGGNALVILTSTAPGNIGTFMISDLVPGSIHDIIITKVFYTSDTILQILRGDVSGDMIFDQTDYNYISNYIEAVPPFPPTTSPANRVGTPFTAIRFTMEEYVDRNDDYPATATNRATTVHPLPDIFLDGYTAFAGQNVELHPIPFSIFEQLTWEQTSVVANSNPRQVPCSFNYQAGYTDTSCGVEGVSVSTTYPQIPPFDPGRNDFFVSNNLVINNGGQIIRPDGYLMRMDFELSTIIIEVPTVSFDGYTVNLLTDFIADFSGTGYTRLGYPAMLFADCTRVSMAALMLNQVKFGVSIQSFSPQLDGVDPTCLDGIIVDGTMGVYVDYSTGLLTLNFGNLYQDIVDPTLNTKVEITVYLKKAGWNNVPIFVDSTKAQNVLNIPNPPPVPPC